MSQPPRLPTLVTLRSAMELREDAMRYAYLRCALFGGMVLGPLSLAAAAWALAHNLTPYVSWGLIAFAAIAIGASSFCGRKLDFPHYCRISHEDMALIVNEMGLPASVIQQTRNNVLLGSHAELRAMQASQRILEKIQSASLQDARKARATLDRSQDT